MKNKILLLILGVIVGATVTFFLLPKNGSNEKVIIREFADTSASTTLVVKADSALPITVVQNSDINKELSKTTNKEENLKYESNSKIIIEDSTYDFYADDKKTLYEAMLEFENKGIVLKTKKFSSLGYLIEAINGKESSNGYYWTLYINDKEALVGVSTYFPKAGDVIEWKYEKR